MADSKILLHICCGPCAIYPLQQLQGQGYEVLGFFYNPNIHPLQEYLKRREGVEQVAKRFGIRVIYPDEEYDPVLYMRRVAFRENSRCLLCYQLRLEKTLAIAKRGRFSFFSSALLYSKHQKHDEIASLARDLAGEGSVSFLYQDFRNGWRQGIELSRQWNIYRQDYCGCLYSEFERRKGLLSRNKG
ncbi:MAG: epoxyqueuosine reductase QueH [Desulfohalobiaceae bacterium]|nr:epoxyqueuosine reductase QueH [Desulfohalobiaceae bacterium]